MVISSVAMDIFGLLFITSLMAGGIIAGTLIYKIDEDEGTIILELTGALGMVYLIEIVLQFMKIYYGLVWFCRGRNR